MPGGEDTGRIILLVEKLDEKIDQARDELKDHAQETIRRWSRHEEIHDRHEDVHAKHEDIHRDLNKTLDEGEKEVDRKIDSIQKDRSAALYWVLGLVGAIILAGLGALWELRGAIDGKAEATAIERKADKEDVKEMRDDVREVKQMLFKIVPPKRGE